CRVNHTTYASHTNFRQPPARDSNRRERDSQSWYMRNHLLSINWILLAMLPHSAGAVCYQIPFHGYGTKYPAFPNNDVQCRQIRNDWSNKHNASFVTWLLNNEAKVVFFKTHNIVTGEVQFECEVDHDELLTDTLVLYRGQPGYIYCQHNPVPDMPDLTTVELILTASSTVSSVVLKPSPAIRLPSRSLPTVSVYNITQNQLGPECSYLIV
ncbi:hypothetical protein P879_04489, partial [Paragonimus westermani]